MSENLKKSVVEVKELLELTKNGKPFSTIDNAAIIFREDPILGGNLKNNLFRERIELTGRMPWPRVTADVNDIDDVHIRHYFEKTYQLTSDKKIRDGMQIVASENGYHPVREFLNSLKWDGTERIRYVLHHFLGAGINDHIYEFMKLFLLGGINRVFHPGCKFEYMLCLVGGQGVGKSSFVRFLACRDEWFCDDIKRLDDERIYEHLVGHWVLEIAEMLALNNVKCNEATKAFLSRQSDNFRLPYGYRAEDRQRQCIFVGTSNIVHFLPNDRSGNRRFLPIMCHADKADVHILENEKESREYICQVWAEAMTIYRSKKYKLHLPKEVEIKLAEYQEPFMQEDTWSELIKTFLEDYSGDIVCTQMLYREALDMYGMPGRIETAQIMEIMSRMPGWIRYSNPRHFQNYKRQKGWERVDHTSDNQPDNQVFKKEYIQESIDDIPFEQPVN
jgi:predicted P-loop ATPase